MCLLGLRQQHLHHRRRPQGNCLLDPERFHQQSLGLMFLLRQYDKDGGRSPDQSLLDSFDRLVEADDPMPEQTWPDFPPETPELSELNVDLSPSES
jgi:hypothetical protein